ncbi:MAG: T9SS type A sorting domain-containing protein [Bacteroidetes bacterium]|nr:T9SS type A sorting domain-containing protein [Bacteroidota bacterium]
MKKLILLFVLSMFVCNANAQTVLLADTAFITDIGYGGAEASCKSNGMIDNSVNMDRVKGTWVADVFHVPAGITWVVDTVIVYGYQYGMRVPSTFTGCNLQIYSGTPGAGGAVRWGDTLTNVLVSTGFTGIYKVDTFAADSGLLSTKRAIMYLKLYLPHPPSLGTGTYWLSWSATCTSTITSATCPYKVLPGRINPPGQQSRILYGGAWQYVIDNGDTAGLNMIIEGNAYLGVDPAQGYRDGTTLHQNVPNPFSHTTTINYNVAEEGNVQLCVYNTLGQRVATLVNGRVDKGTHELNFNADGLPAGVYYYRLATERGMESRAMVVR